MQTLRSLLAPTQFGSTQVLSWLRGAFKGAKTEPAHPVQPDEPPQEEASSIQIGLAEVSCLPPSNRMRGRQETSITQVAEATSSRRSSRKAHDAVSFCGKALPCAAAAAE